MFILQVHQEISLFNAKDKIMKSKRLSDMLKDN